MSGLVALIEAGGWVVALQVAMSVVGLAAVLWKLWQFFRAGVGRHAALDAALASGDRARLTAALATSASPLAVPARAALGHDDPASQRERCEAEMSARLAGLETGFRLLDTIAQTAPLLGLFGTVLGMIGAFQAMQAAGTATDPSVLAGGIWVALLTTAVGLAVGMPAAILLSWFESRTASERILAERLLAAVTEPRPAVDKQLRHAA